MPYLTKGEFTDLLGVEPPSNFQYLLEMASAVLDAETRYFYAVKDLEQDEVPHRAKQFKRAIAMQIMFFDAHDIASVEDLNNRPDVVSIGDTSVSYNRNSSSSESSQRSTAMSQDVANILASIGLLYRGGRNVNFT